MLYLNYNEKQQHGTREFPVAFYRVDVNHPRYEMPFHWHKEFELVRIVSGSFRMLIDNEELCASEHDCIMIPSSIIHGGIPEDCIYECLVFDPDLLHVHSDSCRRYIKKITRQEICIRSLISSVNPQVDETIGKLFSAASDKQTGYELTVLGGLFDLFGLIFRDELYTEPELLGHHPGAHTEQLKSVFEYIESNYASNITLQQLSQLSGMSPKYFCRYFQTIAHRTPMDYLNYYRVERSCSLLCTTDLAITSIAYDCGFNDCSYFIKTFRKYKHTTPKQYQLQMRQF